jgi:pimeloyl-ACP methyl ester carboxylesterase
MSTQEPIGNGSTERPPLFVHRRGTGPLPCVLIHGLGDGAHVWMDLLWNLPAGYQAFAVDLRGHGNSPRSADGRYLVSQHATDVIQTLDMLRVDRAVLVGHSMGGDIAARVTIAHPERVAALVMVDVGMEPRQQVVFNANLKLYRSMRTYASVDEYLETLVRTRPLAPIELLRHCATEALEGSPETGFRLRVDPRFFQPANHPRNDTRLNFEMVSGIVCPTLLVRGALSAVLPKADAIKLAAAIPDCALQEISGAGHAPMLENPVVFREHIHAFLNRVEK